MDYPSVLQALNGYLSKRSAANLKATCKTANAYITVKNYREKMLKLDTSDIAKIIMISHQDNMFQFEDTSSIWFPKKEVPFEFTNFCYYRNNLKLFRNQPIINNWNKEQWVFFLTSTVYYYIINEYVDTGDYDNWYFMDYGGKRWLYDEDLLDELQIVCDEHILDIQNYWTGIACKDRNTQKPTMLSFIDFYNIINKYSLNQLRLNETFQNFEMMDIDEYVN